MWNIEDYRFEIGSGELSKGEFIEEIGRMQGFLLREGITEGMLLYGWSSFAPEDDQPQDKRIHVRDLLRSIQAEVQAERIELCVDNCWLVCEPEHICIRFCDDCDVHFYSDDEKWIEALENWWTGVQSPIYKRRRQEGGEWGPTYVKDELGEWKPYEQ